MRMRHIIQIFAVFIVVMSTAHRLRRLLQRRKRMPVLQTQSEAMSCMSGIVCNAMVRRQMGRPHGFGLGE